MFQAKASYCTRSRDGRAHHFERTFSDARKYRKFLQNHPEHDIGDMFAVFGRGRALDPLGWVADISDEPMQTRSPEDQEYLPTGVSLEKYEDEMARIDEEARTRDQRIRVLEASRDRLYSYIERFEKAGRTDMMDSAKADLEKINTELEKLKSRE